jgi:hypothetical protein
LKFSEDTATAYSGFEIPRENLVVQGGNRFARSAFIHTAQHFNPHSRHPQPSFTSSTQLATCIAAMRKNRTAPA